MKLHVMTPAEIYEADGLEKITADGDNGYFTLLPHHIDCAAALVPGILSYAAEGGEVQYMAVDEGTLVKKGSDVFISCASAVSGGGPGTLRQAVRERAENADDYEKKSRAVIAKLEAEFLKKFMEQR